MKKGFAAVTKYKEEADQRRESFSQGYVPFFSLKDGETVEGLWFNGPADDEPLLVPMHALWGFKEVKKSHSIICGKEHKSGKCVACHASRSGDKRIAKVANKAVLSVADPRFVHRVVDEERSTDDKKRYKYFPCTLDDDTGKGCKRCKRGMRRVHAGQKRWEMSITWANALVTTNAQLQHRCECGGKIRWHSPSKGECQKCDNPRPLNIFEVPFSITRTGADKSTTYQIVPIYGETKPRWVVRLNAPDLAAMYRAKSAEDQAEFLGIDNPFDAYGDDSDDDDDDRGSRRSRRQEASSYDDDDDDDTELPKKAKIRLKKHTEDEDIF